VTGRGPYFACEVTVLRGRKEKESLRFQLEMYKPLVVVQFSRNAATQRFVPFVAQFVCLGYTDDAAKIHSARVLIFIYAYGMADSALHEMGYWQELMHLLLT